MTPFLLALLSCALLLALTARSVVRSGPEQPPQAPTAPAWPFVLMTVALVGASWAAASFFPWLAPLLSAGTLIAVW